MLSFQKTSSRIKVEIYIYFTLSKQLSLISIWLWLHCIFFKYFSFATHVQVERQCACLIDSRERRSKLLLSMHDMTSNQKFNVCFVNVTSFQSKSLIWLINNWDCARRRSYQNYYNFDLFAFLEKKLSSLARKAKKSLHELYDLFIVVQSSTRSLTHCHHDLRDDLWQRELRLSSRHHHRLDQCWVSSSFFFWQITTTFTLIDANDEFTLKSLETSSNSSIVILFARDLDFVERERLLDQIH